MKKTVMTDIKKVITVFFDHFTSNNAFGAQTGEKTKRCYFNIKAEESFYGKRYL